MVLSWLFIAPGAPAGHETVNGKSDDATAVGPPFLTPRLTDGKREGTPMSHARQ